MASEEPDRSFLTFAQAEGRELLPHQLAPGELSQELRSYLWLVVYERLDKATQFSSTGYGGADPWLSSEWERVLKAYWIRHEHQFADEFANDAEWWKRHLGEAFKKGDYIKVFGFLQFIIRSPNVIHRFAEDVQTALVLGRAAYRVVDHTIMPIAGPEDAQNILRAFADLASTEFGGARAHMRGAGELLSAGQWADSVRESIHAVESLIIALDANAKTLSDGLKRLEKSGAINPNLRRAMNALYDYASDEKGVRHAKILEGANVDEADALYMFGACAAFITYVIAKQRTNERRGG